ncbi:hypothetical protein CMI49_00975 [Candidatus Pacearchaeota archaeon]|jgi:hypothetical protein|nr:hypothetical protein [Candidatus Pacearchaeota archaeon]|tara:strand:- start:4833 stop:5633 length:801 start_codon:yes stop_codon:yes gene_type:complete
MITIIQNLYTKNEFINETVRLNLLALEESGVKYQYILFNDNGDKDIYEDIKEFEDKVEYIYSDINCGRRMCTGGWIGALPYVKGDLIHNTGQDDVMTSLFYKKFIEVFDSRDDIYLVFSNGFRVNENLIVGGLLNNPQFILDYEQPLEVFKFWFGIDENGENKVTKANNNIPAPGTIYRRELHDLIGEPGVHEFGGACDFEYWSRILFNEYKCHYINFPLWLYRRSKYSAASGTIDGKNVGDYWRNLSIDHIKEKYTKLWEEKCNQ